ncbi:MAG TPA: UDP-N-acetylmuramate dehydrogenase [Frankiaceae bacterium]|nr:UDP-N-acetylmuramate dehydrogenase [Frankiaceae bacterium]
MTDPRSGLQQVPLATLTTIGVGGPANDVAAVHSTDELVSVVHAADSGGRPLLLLGGGSNVVVSDAGFSGLAVLIRTQGIARDGGRLRVAAGESWDALVAYAVDQQLAGIECLAGIPGLVGATPIQNVGAYGQEVSDVVTRVTAYDRQARVLRDLDPSVCRFGYRTSRFKAESGRWVVTEVEFTLRPGDMSRPRYGELSRTLGLEAGGAAPVERVREAVLALRRGKGMVLDPSDPDTASCGSFFTNPVLDAEGYDRLCARAGVDAPAFPEAGERFKVPAAWLMERAGFPKGYGSVASGAARLSTKHVLAITNRGGASAGEVLALAREVRDRVWERLGVLLVNEPVIVGAEL